MARRHAYGLLIGLTGSALAVIQALHGLQQSTRPIVLAFEALPFVLVGLAVTYAGYWLARQESYEPDLPRVLAWSVGSTLLFASVAALMLFGRNVSMGTLQRGSFIAMDLITVGVVVGVVVGLYDARGQQRLRTLERQRDRIEEFANKAADVNNYGQALNRSSSVHDVSGLCIQAMQALLGLSEVAIVAIGDEVETIDNTIINTDQSDLEQLAEQARDQERATVTTHDTLPDPLAERGDSALSMLLTTRDDHAIAIIALVPEGVTFDDEDLQLVEFLGSHAGTALDGLRNSESEVESTPQGE